MDTSAMRQTTPLVRWWVLRVVLWVTTFALIDLPEKRDSKNIHGIGYYVVETESNDPMLFFLANVRTFMHATYIVTRNKANNHTEDACFAKATTRRAATTQELS